MRAICSKCRREVPSFSQQETGQYSCKCGTVIPYQNGILQFAPVDDFYEGKFTETHENNSVLKSNILRLMSIDGNEERMWKKSTKYITQHLKNKRLEILNIGSGGGHGFLNELGTVTAIDLSLQSLLNAQKIYDFCYQADAQFMPFPDNSFDLVFSSHLLGHIPLELKQEVIKEIYRVTKPGGFSLHSAECEADNFIYSKAKKYPDQYKTYFQDMYGHYGLEKPSLCKKRFRDEMFEPVYEMSDYCKGIIRSVGSYKVFFGTVDFKEKNRIFYTLATVSEILSFNKYIRFVSNILLYPFTVLNRLGGPDSVDSIKLLYRKK